MLLVLASCGTESDRMPKEEIERHLREIASAPDPPVYYLGESFAGLTLTNVFQEAPGGVKGPGRAQFIYGTCRLPLFGDSGCQPPIQVQNELFDDGHWSDVVGCARLAPLRGVPTVRLDGLVLLTGGTRVKIYARSEAEERRAALALRAVGTNTGAVPATLPAPRKDVPPTIDSACGARPGESGRPLPE